MKNNLTRFLFFFVAFCFLNANKKPPKTAIGSLPTPTLGNIFSGPNDIGYHNYSGSKGEGNGIILTCLGGHIDLAHVRSTADWTRYAYKIIFNELQKTSNHISFRTTVDPSIFQINIKYPEYWKTMSKDLKKKKIHLISKELAKYVIFNAANWHEILTWFGYSKVRFFSEYPSSFSWEDSFSNMMGIYLVDKVLDLEDNDYNIEMTKSLQIEMESLIMLDRTESIATTNKVKNLWYKGWVPGLLIMKYRNFDIGNNDGYINPTIIPNNDFCSEKLHPGYKIPTLKNVNEYGVLFELNIEPKEHTKKEILKVVYGENFKKYSSINSEKHIPLIMKYIKKKALEKGYKFID